MMASENVNPCAAIIRWAGRP